MTTIVVLFFSAAVLLGLFFLLLPIGGIWSILFGVWIVVGVAKALAPKDR